MNKEKGYARNFIGNMQKTSQRLEWVQEFEAARKRPLHVHFNNAFIHTYKPVMDDASCRSFNTMREYREWCEEKLPKWLGYGKSL